MSGHDEERPFLETPLVSLGVPPPTRWRHYCCSKWCWVVVGEEENPRCEHVRVRVLPVPIELLMIAISYVQWYIYVCPYLPWPSVHFFLMTFVGASTLLLVTLSWLVDPGYLPYFYPLTGRTTFTPAEMRSGTASNSSQRAWARRQRRPARIVFAETTGRYVIRGDHYCVFVDNWIGLYNHRYFLLAVAYMTIYIVLYAAHLLFQYFKSKGHIPRWQMAILIGEGLAFGTLTLGSMLQQCNLVASNRVVVDLLKGRKQSFDRGIVNNCEEVCGPRKYFWLWWLPIPLPLGTDGFSYGDIDPMILLEPPPACDIAPGEPNGRTIRFTDP
jgi:hypothetical protein